MSKLIYADSLRQDILALPNCYNGFSDTYDKACIIGVIDEQQPVDAVPVVRCKDCKHLKLTGGNESTGEGVYTCDVWKRPAFKGNGFCSYAERRSDDSD